MPRRRLKGLHRSDRQGARVLCRGFVYVAIFIDLNVARGNEGVY